MRKDLFIIGVIWSILGFLFEVVCNSTMAGKSKNQAKLVLHYFLCGPVIWYFFSILGLLKIITWLFTKPLQKYICWIKY